MNPADRAFVWAVTTVLTTTLGALLAYTFAMGGQYR